MKPSLKNRQEIFYPGYEPIEIEHPKILYPELMKQILEILQGLNTEKSSVPKKRRKRRRRRFKPLVYPELIESNSKTFHINYTRTLSPVAKLILNTFQKKYLYYAIDDILYGLKSNPTERDNLLSLLYSPVLSLQNNLCINFFDIWIDEIYIQEIVKKNKFLSNNCPNPERVYTITIKLFYRQRTPAKKPEAFW
jgi:hypothetical protein